MTEGPTASHTAAIPATPIADALLAGAARTRVQFQALPLAGAASISGSALREKYLSVFGPAFLEADTVFAGRAFDSFFFPETVIREAERLAANAFGAQHVLFVTTGTSVSNQIALLALVAAGDRVLVDRTCHQSIHFSLHAAGVSVNYLESIHQCEITERSWWSLDALVDQVESAEKAGRPFKLIALNSQSYDGVVYSIPAVLEALVTRGVALPALLVDEAWSTSAYFHSTRAAHTAMAAAARFAHLGVTVVATHSIHKSTSCLRQGSVILAYGGQDLAEALGNARYRLHTTSPSYPILASIDLARAQMVLEGEAMNRMAEHAALTFETRIQDDPSLSIFRVNRTQVSDQVANYVFIDQSKVSIDISGLGLSPAEVKDTLHSDYGIWVRRSTAAAILLNVHIGIGEAGIELLLNALRDLQRKTLAAVDDINSASAENVYPQSKHFVIPYPPGIPIVMPGDLLTPAVVKRIAAIKKSGTHVFSIY